MNKERKCQIVRCKCGSTIAVCAVPHCYTDKDWIKDIKTYAKKGYEIDLIPTQELDFGECTYNTQKNTQSSLF